VGIIVGWFALGRWFSVAGFAVVLLGVLVPWPSHAVTVVLVVTGALVMLLQIPVRHRLPRRQYPRHPT
jgi:uncharacterized protein YhhL (DUF1145 family)